MSWGAVVDVVAAALLVVGALLTLTAAIGILRFPDVLTRMHSATKPQVLGLLAVLLALGLRLHDLRSIGLLALVALFQLVTSPIASHMVGRASFRAGHVGADLVVDELTDVLPPIDAAPTPELPQSRRSQPDPETSHPPEVPPPPDEPASP